MHPIDGYFHAHRFDFAPSEYWIWLICFLCVRTTKIPSDVKWLRFSISSLFFASVIHWMEANHKRKRFISIKLACVHVLFVILTLLRWVKFILIQPKKRLTTAPRVWWQLTATITSVLFVCVRASSLSAYLFPSLLVAFLPFHLFFLASEWSLQHAWAGKMNKTQLFMRFIWYRRFCCFCFFVSSNIDDVW